MPYVPEVPESPNTAADSLVCHTAHFDTTWPEPATAVVAADGELDAANGNEFVSYALRNAEQTQWLIVDLSNLTFFSTAGFSALHTLNVQCVGEDIRWVLVPSKAVNRVLRICDPDSALRISADVTEALTAVHAEPPRSLELVAQSR
ncbi:anti-sigma factor antagonist [Mycobacterium sp. ITM-2017-0098]|nr:anti-sigma factor antagonist [Mycobacterium sp. ITM-2017-0098]